MTNIDNKLRITVVGSINLDIVARAETLPLPGETLIGANIERHPGGKGANQALAAQRLGAEVALIACVGDDGFAEEALTLLKQDKVNLNGCKVSTAHATGIALIVVSDSGENQIVVGSGANSALLPGMMELPPNDAIICQLEIPMETVFAAAKSCESFFCLNAAPATKLDPELLSHVDLLIVNEVEAGMLKAEISVYSGYLAISYGARGASLFEDGVEIAKSMPPSVEAVDTTACGDAFTAALTLNLIAGDSPQNALDKACIVGALTATKAGAQSSLPYAEAVRDFV